MKVPGKIEVIELSAALVIFDRKKTNQNLNNHEKFESVNASLHHQRF